MISCNIAQKKYQEIAIVSRYFSPLYYHQVLSSPQGLIIPYLLYIIKRCTRLFGNKKSVTTSQEYEYMDG